MKLNLGKTRRRDCEKGEWERGTTYVDTWAIFYDGYNSTKIH
jgi:hypothetical protein